MAPGSLSCPLSIQAAPETSAAPGRPFPAITTSWFSSGEIISRENSRLSGGKKPTLARNMSGEELETAITFLGWPPSGALHPDPPRCSEVEEHHGGLQNP